LQAREHHLVDVEANHIEDPQRILDARDVHKAFKEDVVLGGLNLSLRRGEFVSVVGPSGCGKTTLLMALAGLIPIDKGKIRYEGHDVVEPLAGTSLVFQDYSRSLMPWLRNVDNVLFGMRRVTAKSKLQKRDVALHMLAVVGLQGFEGHYPWQVSGGMQQRVAIARALASQSNLLLLDEPLVALDAQTRNDIQDLLLGLTSRFSMTCLLVTHDVDEAVYMADRVLVMSQRPATVMHEFAVTFKRPRDQIQTRAQPDYLKIRADVLSMVRRQPTHHQPPNAEEPTG
jgi:NitT/TauT family transport system ATP-binding protein